ncbi:helix-turn-helix domain-containing protein [Lacticaseibacillus rhamnosus]|uniref:helix-turn-helix domain-containing protein n=1 Tax=Lacticaseibacillus rhamnosus TaxID=47715 RepID=UPI00237FB099|nr:helix-turn-helix transcriptional regulator [Lacticaseibacillus rhamnosus]MDE3297210.1 helix-turn-helix domain-containing protein [Lacticaseibacillus rhamnosus]
MQFSDKLKQARQQHHLTQMQVGTQLHVSAKTISSWENGRSFPDISTLVSISDLYQISLDQLLREDQDIVQHYETINKQAQRYQKYFQITYFLNILLILAIWAVQITSSNSKHILAWLFLALVVNLVVMATHYPDYRTWINGTAHRLLLILLAVGLSTVLLVISFDGAASLNAAKASSNQSVEYLIGFYTGLLTKPLIEASSIIYAIFGFAELKEQP